MADTPDPVLAARARWARWVSLGLRGGYGLYGLAVVLFALAMLVGFTPLLGAALTFCLIAGSIVLAPAIMFNYAVKAANRADRDGTW